MKNILVTGQTGIGKTTLLRRLAEIFKEFNPAGFYMSDIVEQDVKTGSLITPLFGDSQVFAHINVKSKYGIGKIKLDIKTFEALLTSLFSKDKKTGLYMLDEIGKMQCMSRKFCRLIKELMDSEKPVIAVIPEKPPAFFADIKKRSDVSIVEITEENRDLKLKELTMEIRDLLLE